MSVFDDLTVLDQRQARCNEAEDYLWQQLGLAQGRAQVNFEQDFALTEQAFLVALDREYERCSEIDDYLAMLTVNFAEDLDEEQRKALVRDLGEVAGRAGDVLGHYDDGYAIALPWVDPDDARLLAETVRQIAMRHGTPVVSLAAGRPAELGPGVASLQSKTMPVFQPGTPPIGMKRATRSRAS